MTEQERVSLKEHFLALRQEQEKALELQAVEYQRRLEALNHENARVADQARASVPKGEYIIQMDNFEKRLTKLEDLASFGAGSRSSWATGGSLIYFILIVMAAIASVAISLFLK
jgi:hypothetical protein